MSTSKLLHGALALELNEVTSRDDEGSSLLSRDPQNDVVRVW